MANPVQGTTVPCACTFTAYGLSNKAGTLSSIIANEIGVAYYVTYLDSNDDIQTLRLTASAITLGA